MICSICFSASLVHGCPDHTHPPRKIWWRKRKLGTIDLYAFFVFSIDVEVKFSKIDQTVGSQGLTGLVDETCIVLDLQPN